jgi:hypothetical protein
MKYLDQQNAKNAIAAKLNVTQGIVYDILHLCYSQSEQKLSGLFDTDGGRTFQLMVDVKINGAQ